jgi:hypothetical protein
LLLFGDVLSYAIQFPPRVIDLVLCLVLLLAVHVRQGFTHPALGPA